MNILLTNDDGVHAMGIAKLAAALSKEHRVLIVAPSGERSASGHAITMNLPLFVREVKLPGLDHVPAHAVSGTPADSVKLGLRVVADFPIDLVVSGINIGSNLGSDIFCSGTASAAMEAAVMGYKAIAVSLAVQNIEELAYLDDAAKVMYGLIRQIDVKNDIDQVLNVNIPAMPIDEMKGYRVAPQGKVQYDEHYEKRTDPRGREYYWLSGGYIGDRTEEETDSTILSQGYIAVTPLRCDLTDERHMESKKSKLESLQLRS